MLITKYLRSRKWYSAASPASAARYRLSTLTRPAERHGLRWKGHLPSYLALWSFPLLPLVSEPTVAMLELLSTSCVSCSGMCVTIC